MGITGNGAYSALYREYDALNSETDYSHWAEFIEKIFLKHGKKKIESVLDMGCGTGSMTFALHRRGFDMTALDISCDMLSVARDTADSQNIGDILWLCQDMRSFELYGTVDAAVCCLDGINHLTGVGDMDRCFSLVHNYLEPYGLFVVDVNTPHKFVNFYAGHDYILEDDGVVCCWQNSYDEKNKLCDFYLSVFEETESGMWRRTDTVQKERCYSLDEISKSLSAAGMKLEGVYSDFSFSPAGDDDSRWYIVASAEK